MLTLFVERIQKQIVKFVSRLEKRNKVKPRNLLLFVCCLNGIYICFLSYLGFGTGSLTFGNSAYMAVITFTTVGLGDYAPPFFNKGRPFWFIACGYGLAAVTMVIGLNLVSALLSTIRLWVRKEVAVLTAQKTQRALAKIKMIGRLKAGMNAAKRKQQLGDMADPLEGKDGEDEDSSGSEDEPEPGTPAASAETRVAEPAAAPAAKSAEPEESSCEA